MGHSTRFLCPGFAYSAHASGGSTMLMRAATSSAVCADCREVFEALTHSPELGNFASPDRPDGADTGASRRCLTDPTHRVAPGEPDHPCPKCGRPMDDTREWILAD